MATIYGLLDPRDDQIHYVGKASYPDERKKAWMKAARAFFDKNPHLAAWFCSMGLVEVEPEFVVLERCTQKDAHKRERWWINAGFNLHWPLCNIAVLKDLKQARDRGFPYDS